MRSAAVDGAGAAFQTTVAPAARAMRAAARWRRRDLVLQDEHVVGPDRLERVVRHPRVEEVVGAGKDDDGVLRALVDGDDRAAGGAPGRFEIDAVSTPRAARASSRAFASASSPTSPTIRVGAPAAAAAMAWLAPLPPGEAWADCASTVSPGRGRARIR